MMTAASKPEISVIIPVLNHAARVRRCVNALLSQTLPRDHYEIIVVDNGSDDETTEVLAKLPVRFFSRPSPKTPYAARNHGLDKASGKILAFTDASCTPDPRWLEKGMKPIVSGQADLVGGHVQFTFSNSKHAAERFDSLINVEVKENIARKGVTKTGNLFVRKDIFTQIGPFREDVRSGGDVEWTGRATRSGFRLVYEPDALVYYPARSFWPLMKKMYRIGKGQPENWKRENLSGSQLAWRILYDLRPMLPGFIADQIAFRGQKEVPNSTISLMAVGWSCRLATGAGRLAGLRLARKRQGKRGQGKSDEYESRQV